MAQTMMERFERILIEIMDQITQKVDTYYSPISSLTSAYNPNYYDFKQQYENHPFYHVFLENYLREYFFYKLHKELFKKSVNNVFWWYLAREESSLVPKMKRSNFPRFDLYLNGFKGLSLDISNLQEKNI